MPNHNAPTVETTRSLAHYESATLEEYLSDPELTYNGLLRRRMNEVRLLPKDQLFLVNYPDVLHLAVLVTPDDPDTIAVLPALAKLVAASPRLDLRILREDDDLTLFDRLVDDIELVDQLDDLDLPQLFIFDEEWQIQEQWGPRPKEADKRLDEWLSEHPEYEALAESDDNIAQDEYTTLLDTLVYTMRLWYNSGLNQACIDEVVALLAGLQSDDDGNGNNDNGRS